MNIKICILHISNMLSTIHLCYVQVVKWSDVSVVVFLNVVFFSLQKYCPSSKQYWARLPTFPARYRNVPRPVASSASSGTRTTRWCLCTRWTRGTAGLHTRCMFPAIDYVVGLASIPAPGPLCFVWPPSRRWMQAYTTAASTTGGTGLTCTPSCSRS